MDEFGAAVDSHLLVSVRDAVEAAAALAGGANLIDIKEPSRGPLGRADLAVTAAVLQAVGGRVPVSAALGELRDCPLGREMAEPPPAVRYVKWGLAGLCRQSWQRRLSEAISMAGSCLVAV